VAYVVPLFFFSSPPQPLSIYDRNSNPEKEKPKKKRKKRKEKKKKRDEDTRNNRLKPKIK